MRAVPGPGFMVFAVSGTPPGMLSPSQGEFAFQTHRRSRTRTFQPLSPDAEPYGGAPSAPPVTRTEHTPPPVHATPRAAPTPASAR